MSEIEEKLGAVLNNPQMMQQLMTMAQSLGLSSETAPEPKQETSGPPIDMVMLQKLSGIAGQSGVDREQQNLLKALAPYLSRDKVSKLERAMRAAKMARLASTFFNQGGLSLLTGR